VLGITLLLAAGVLAYLLDAALVGIALSAVLWRLNWSCSFRAQALLLVCIFMILDLWWQFALASVGLTCSVANPTIARMLHVGPDFPVADLVSIGAIDALAWLAQTGMWTVRWQK